MKNTHPFDTSFQALKVGLHLIKLTATSFYFLLFYSSFHISKNHFSQLFRTSFIWKKIFVMNFLFLTDFPHHPNEESPLTMT